MLSTTILTCLEKLHPAITTELRNIILLSNDSTDAALLTLCTGYIDAALRNQKWNPPEQGLTDKEHAFIAFTEKFVTSVSTISDEQVDDLLKFASADEVYMFVNAIYITDMSLRLELVAAKVLL